MDLKEYLENTFGMMAGDSSGDIDVTITATGFHIMSQTFKIPIERAEEAISLAEGKLLTNECFRKLINPDYDYTGVYKVSVDGAEYTNEDAEYMFVKSWDANCSTFGPIKAAKALGECWAVKIGAINPPVIKFFPDGRRIVEKSKSFLLKFAVRFGSVYFSNSGDAFTTRDLYAGCDFVFAKFGKHGAMWKSGTGEPIPFDQFEEFSNYVLVDGVTTLHKMK